MSENNKNTSANVLLEHALDEVTYAYVQELQAKTANLQTCLNTALELEVRRFKLEGQWTLSPDARRLVRVDAPNAMKATAQ
jgi:hypothetical protein